MADAEITVPALFHGKEENMTEGKTKSGFAFKIDEDVRDDMELLEGFIDLDDGDMKALPKCIIALLGKEQKIALYNHCRSEKTGRVSASKVMKEVKEILDFASEEVKN